MLARSRMRVMGEGVAGVPGEDEALREKHRQGMLRNVKANVYTRREEEEEYTW